MPREGMFLDNGGASRMSQGMETAEATGRSLPWACAECPAQPCVVCQPLPRDARRELAAVIDARSYPAHAEIGGASEAGLSILASGLALTERRLADERRQVVAFRFPGDVLCFDPKAAVASRLRLMTVTPAVVCRLPAAVLGDLGREHDDFIEGLMKSSCREVAWLGERLLMLGRMTAEERIASFLMEMLVRSHGSDEEAGPVAVNLPMNREDIADYLGLNVETVSRTLSRFKRSGLIRLPKPGRAEIDDMAPLKALVPIRLDHLRTAA